MFPDDISGDRPVEPTAAPPPRPRITPPGEDALSIAEFCRRHAISQSFYFALQADGKGPRTMQVGSRIMISREAAAAWRRRRERAPKRKRVTKRGGATAAAE